MIRPDAEALPVGDDAAPVDERRSVLMAKIRGKNTRPELLVRRMAHALGFRFRLHRRDLPGTPDLAFPGRRTVIFVHGCFWHRHPGCRLASMPKTRVAFWKAKFVANVERDRRKEGELRAAGWKVGTVWECETRKPELLCERVSEILGPPASVTPSESRSAPPAAV